MIDEERRNRFAVAGEAATRLSRYFLALSFEPSLHGGKKAARRVFSAEDSGQDGPGDKALALFQKRVSEIDSLLQSDLLQARRLLSTKRRVGETHRTFDLFLQYVRQCITGEDYPFARPETPIFRN